MLGLLRNGPRRHEGNAGGGRVVLAILSSRQTSLHQTQRPLQIRLEILNLLQSNVEPDDAMPVIGTSRVALKVVGHRQARNSTPAISDLEQLQRVYEREHLFFRELPLKNDGEDSRRPREIAQPELVPRA